MSNFTDKIIRQIKRPDGKFSEALRKFDMFSRGGNAGIIVRLIIGAAIYLLTCLPFLRNGFGMFFQILAFLLCSYDVMLEAFGLITGKRFFAPRVMISIAALLAVCVGYAADALLFIVIYRAFEIIIALIIKRNERDVMRVLNLRVKDVKVYTAGGKLMNTPVSKVNTGDHYMVAPGDRIPLDGIVADGVSEIDTETLTGETVLRKVHKGSPVLSGSVNVSGTLSVRVTADLENSFVTKRLQYVEGYKEYDKKVSRSLSFFNSIFTPVAMIVSLFVGIVPPIILGNFTYWLHNASVLLALCCPVPVFAASAITYFAGVGGAAAKGVLFKDKEAIDSMAKAGCVLFDKNGTLSTGRFVVTDIEAERVTGKELLELASYAYAKADNPLAKAIMANVEKMPDLSKIVNNYEEAGKCCVVQLSDGRVVAAGNEAMLKMMEMPVPENQNCDTVVYICVGRDYMGCIHLTDKFRSDAKVAVSKLRELEIANVAMVSSESKGTSAVIAKNLELDNAYMAYGEKEKTNVFDYLIKELPAEEALVYVGNGYDDPQLLEYTDVGVAMNGLIYENARKYSNVILVKSEPSGISTAVRYAKKIKEVCDTNAVIMTAATAMTAMLAIFGKVNLWTAALILGIAVVVTMLYARRAYSIKK